MRTRRVVGVAAALFLGAVLAACSDVTQPTAPVATPRAGMVATAPSPLVDVTYGQSTLELWPYTGDNFTGTTVDPINLLFPGTTVQQVRAALLGLGGTRAGYPPMAPFNCVWQDGGETVQVGYADGKWVGSPVQLTCGDYSFRYHVRLFQAGGWVYGGAHFEIQVPGTNSHNVLSWKAARDLVMGDLAGAGFVDFVSPNTDLGTGARYRVMNYPMVYYGLLQQVEAMGGAALAALLQGYINVQTESPLVLHLDNGPAATIHLANAPAVERTVERTEFTLNFNQDIPKPFCGLGFVHAEGPIQMVRQLVVTGSGNYVTHFQGKGKLTITPLGSDEPAYTAIASEKDRSLVTDQHTMVANAQMQIMLPNAPERGSLMLSFTVGPQGATNFDFAVNCTK